jgi:AcrR family transcriptional regulator
MPYTVSELGYGVRHGYREGVPNRAPEDLVWDESEPAGSDALTRAEIVQAALDIADAEGLEAVSIRRVAAALGMRPMSIYSHIASKEDLVALMLHEFSGRLLVPEPLPDDWRAALRLIARRAYDAYVQHAWALQAFGRGTRVGPNMLRRAEQSAAAVAGLDLAPADAWIALSIVHEWTIGHALHVVTLRDDEELEGQLDGADPEEFPRMTRVFGDGREQSRETIFAVALEAVLDGIERRLLAG